MLLGAHIAGDSSVHFKKLQSIWPMKKVELRQVVSIASSKE
jgi:hypothetical protein